jgi:hypothetical protein
MKTKLNRVLCLVCLVRISGNQNEAESKKTEIHLIIWSSRILEHKKENAGISLVSFYKMWNKWAYFFPLV